MRLALLACLVGALVSSANAAPLTPNQEIEGLLAYVGSLQGAVFIRNGAPHSSSEAVSHLRTKWQFAGGRITSAEQFIAYCATGSSITGKPYLIQFPDGHTEAAADLLRRELGVMRESRRK